MKLTDFSKERLLQILNQMSSDDHYRCYLKLTLTIQSLQAALFGAVTSGTAACLAHIARNHDWTGSARALDFLAVASAFYTLGMIILNQIIARKAP